MGHQDGSYGTWPRPQLAETLFDASHARGVDRSTLRHAVDAAAGEAMLAWTAARVVMSQAVWSLLEQDPSLSVRAIATELGLSKSEVDRIVRRFRNDDGSLEPIRFDLSDERGRDVVGIRAADFNKVREAWSRGAERAARDRA